MKKLIWKYPNIAAPPEYKLRKPESKQRYSILDDHYQQSRLNKSEFRGFFNLLIIFGIFFIFTKPTLNFFQTGTFLSPVLFNTFKDDFFYCLSIWPILYFWSHTSFILEKMIIYGLNQKIAFVIQHLSQSGLFMFSIYILMTNNWCSTHAAFVILQTCVHFMKMHSYSTTNKDYRQQKMEALKNNQKILSTYPNNVNIYNFTRFMWTPILVYDQVFPISKQPINYFYIFKKSIFTLLSILAVYIIHTDYIQPHIQKGQAISSIQLILVCILPLTVVLLLLFYIVFENILNIFAQITRLSDRQFYADWWNSTSFEEYNRLWNKPVHNFLYRHVYLTCLLKYQTSKEWAQFITFMFSALLHELLFVVLFKIVRPILLLFMLGQIPLIYVTNRLKGTQYGNYFFWTGLTLGPSLILTGYLRADPYVTHLFSRSEITL